VNVKPSYGPEFFKAEIDRDVQQLASGLSEDQRLFVSKRLAAAREYLKELEAKAQPK
jgi:hypothetical protein